MADKKPKTLGEYIQVEMAKGVPVTIERKNMTDEEWAKVKKNARDSGKLVEDLSEPDAASTDEQARVRAMGNKIEKNRREQYDRENPDLKDLQPEASADPGMSVRGQMQKLATGATPKGHPSAHARTRTMPELDISGRSPHDDGTRRMPEMDISPTNEITQEDVDAFETKKALEKSVKDNEAAAQMAEGLDFTTPSSRLAARVKAADDEFKRGDFEADPRLSDISSSEPEVSSTITDNNDTNVVPTRKPLQFGRDALTSAAADAGGVQNPTNPSLLEEIDQFGNRIGKGLQSVLLPKTTAAESYVPGTSPDAGVPPALPPGAAPPAGGPPPAVAGAPVGPGGSMSASIKTSTPGSGALPPVQDVYAEERQKMLAAAQGAKEAHGEMTKVEESRLKAESKVLDDKIRFTAENEKKRLTAMSAYEETLAKGQQTMNSIADERRALMNTKIDPDAYYTKGGVGRAVLSTLSGAMFGWVGQGGQFLQRLDNLAQQEVKNQQDELARRSGELSLIATDKKNVIAMAREAGLTQVESLAAAKVSFFESVKDQIAKIATDNPMLAAQAQLQMAQIDQRLAGDLMALKQANQTAAHQSVQDRIAMMNAQTNRMEARAKVEAAGAGGRHPMKPSEKERMSEFLTMGDTLARMSKEYKEARGNSWAATGAVSKAVGVGGSTKANRWDKAMDTFTQLIGKPIEGGVVREEDTKRYKGSYIPNVSDTDELAAQKQKGLLEYATAKYANEYNTHIAAGAEGIENFPSPAVYRSYLEDKMGVGGVQGEKPYGSR